MGSELLESRLYLSVYYDLSVVAKPGQASLTGVNGGGSINDSGKMAFAGTVTGGQSIFVGNGRSAPINITPGFVSSSRTFGAGIQINNSGNVSAQDRFSGGDTVTLVRRWSGDTAPNAFVTIANGISPADRSLLPDYYDILASSTSLNNSGQVAFAGLDDTQWDVNLSSTLVDRRNLQNLLLTPIPEAATVIAGSFFRQRAGDGDRILVSSRRSGEPTSLFLYDLTGLDTHEVIATTGTKWSELGVGANLSDDGRVVAFYGNESADVDGDEVLGPGIFAAIDDDDNLLTRSRIVRLTGSHSKVLGYASDGTAITFTENGYEVDSPLGVIHQSLGDTGIVGDSIVVAFIGTPGRANDSGSGLNPGFTAPNIFSAQKGLWTIRLDTALPRSGTGALQYNVTSALPVVQVNDVIDGSTVNAITVYDPIASATRDENGTTRTPRRGDHWIGFVANTANGSKVVRGAHFDTDEDGLLDHWETKGIDSDNDGVIDLRLPQMGSNVNHRDLFLEIDWLAPDATTNRSFAPQPEAIDFLVNVFAAHNITVHIDAGKDIPGGPSLTRGMNSDPTLREGGDLISQAGTGKPIQVLYFGPDGSQSFTGQTDPRFGLSRPVVSRSFESIKDNFFGTHDKRAREFAFHYAVFSDLQSGSNTKETSFNNFAEILADASSGLAEISFYEDPNNSTAPNWHAIPGNDLIISLQGLAEYDSNGDGIPDIQNPSGSGPRVNVPVGYVQGNTLVHELGHNLGLIHGGVDNGVNNSGVGPPQYRSLMSYRYQLSPDSAGAVVRDYSSNGGSGSFDDWSYLRLDFAAYLDNVGNTLGSDRGTSSLLPLPEQNPEDILGPLDNQVPSVVITSPIANSTVAIGGTFSAIANAEDNLAMSRVLFSFDANGNGKVEPLETILANKVGDTEYRIQINSVTGAVGIRTLYATAIDSAGHFTTEESIVRVTSEQSPPVIGAFDATVTYTEGAVPVLIDSNATVIDLDSANFAGGKLTVAVSANSQTTDRIGIKHVGILAGQIGVSGTTVSYGGVAIGTFAGTTSLVVTLNDKATPASVQALLRSITFASVSENPSTLDRTVNVTLTDGDGGTSNQPTKVVKVVAVNDVPVIGAFDTTVSYTENAVPGLIDSNATIIDLDSANFAGGKLTVSVSANSQTTDRIGIKHVGILAGQIGVSGTTVSYGGVAIGTFAGTTSLVVTLNDKATPAAVQALVRSITFSSVSENPSVLDRMIKVTLTDGDGGTSVSPTKAVKVVASNDSPVLQLSGLHLDFEAGVPGTIVDRNGVGTGFSHRLPGSGSAIAVIDPNLVLDVLNGRLILGSTRSSIGDNGFGRNLSGMETPGVLLPKLGSQNFSVEAVFSNLQVDELSDQIGIYAGSTVDNVLRGGVHELSSPAYQGIIISSQNGVDQSPNFISPLSDDLQNKFSRGDRARFQIQRVNQLWSFTWTNLTTGWYLKSAEFKQPQLDSATDLYVGVFNHDARNVTPQEAFLESFTVESPVSYTENAIPALLDAKATVSDGDSANFAGGKITVAVTTNSQVTDRIGIRHTGNSAGQIGVSGTTVSYGGMAIGTFAGTTSFVVTLNEKATPAAVQALVRNITFASVSENPSTLDRTVKFSLTDGDGGTSNQPTKVVKVFAVNDAPMIGAFDATVTYIENAVPVLIDSNATVIDLDSANFAGGKLTVAVSANIQSTDRIGIKHVGILAGQIGVSGTTVSYGGVAIGTFAGTTSLVVTLNDKATPASVQALLRSITFASVSENPSTLDRTVSITLTDGDGGTSNQPTKVVKVVAVNDVPVIGAFDTTVTYAENAVSLLIDNNATAIDVDSANLAGGKLTVAVSANGQTTDRIGIKHAGNLAGQIGVSGTTVSYGGVAIGTFAGTTSLVVTLNDRATPLAVQALVRSMTFSSVSKNPSVLDRTIKVTLTDGDGGTSASPTKTVKVVAVNDVPVIGAFDTPVEYTAKGTPVVLDANATVIDVDSGNFNTGALTVSVIAGGQLTDQIEVRNQGTGVGQIGMSGLNVTYGGTIIGSFTGTTSLKVIFNAAATPAAVQALLRNITFRSTSATPSTTPRTIKVTLTDGDGGTSNQPVKTVTVSVVSPAASRSQKSSLSFNDLDLTFEMGLVEEDLLAVG